MNDDALRDEQLKAPRRLIEALRRASSERIFVPPAIDETMFKAAERHLSPSGRKQVRKVWWWTSLATASALVAALALVTYQWQLSPSSRFSLEDVNHDGQIDILDAFALARQVRDGISAEKRLDVNGDGVVDEKDAATIAAHAVKLERGGRS
jgi:hypothetical protein